MTMGLVLRFAADALGKEADGVWHHIRHRGEPVTIASRPEQLELRRRCVKRHDSLEPTCCQILGCNARIATFQHVMVAALIMPLFSVAIVRADVLPTADGFYGIWYSNAPSGDQYAYKYSGGLGTYPQQTAPIAFYSDTVDRTYFLYGGTDGTNNSLKNYLSYYDHATGLLARPRELRHVGGRDIHKNATLSIDDDGYLWGFGNSHGNSGTGNLYRSAAPHDITAMVDVGLPGGIFNNNAGQVKLSYSSPIYVPGQGMLVTYNQYDDGRSVHVATANVDDGQIDWIGNERLIKIGGQYQIARRNGDTVGIAANYHPGGLNNRTNLYYLETSDLSQTWKTVDGTVIADTLTTPNNAALVHNYQAEKRLVYLKDINWDTQGNPILMYLTVSDETGSGHLSGPQPGERTLHTAHWTGSAWNIRDVLQTKHNYNHGELYVEPDGTWRVIGPFIDGPQVYGTGGEVGVWTSHDAGTNWQLVTQLTDNSVFNHTYVRRPVAARDDFYSYWADGNPFEQSQSRLYFATKSGDVYRMPTNFVGDFAAPVLVTDFSDPGDEPDPDPQVPTRAYEGFAYGTIGGVALEGKSGGFGWAGPWMLSGAGDQGEFTVLNEGSLNSPVESAKVTGGRLRIAGPGTTGSNTIRIDRNLASPFDLGQDGVAYLSFLFRKDSSVPGSNNNLEFDLVAAGSGTPVRIGSTSNDQWFVSIADDAFGAVALGQTYLLVLKVEANADSPDVRSILIFDPTREVPISEPEDWDFSNSFTSSDVITSARLWVGRLAAGQIDELRIGTSWADVTNGSPLVGDFNADGVVDAADYVVWRDGLSEKYTLEQYYDWRANFGNSLNGEGGAAYFSVPEPANWSMLMFTFLAHVANRLRLR